MKTLLTILLLSTALAGAQTLEIDAGAQAKLTAKVSRLMGKIYVSGVITAKLPGMHHGASHVDVELLDAGGHVVAAETDYVGKPTGHPQTSRHGKEKFVVSFPAGVSRETVRVRVIFHNHAHASCANER